MNLDDVLRDLDGQIRSAVSFFWTTRVAQGQRQGRITGDRDRGGRAAVTGGGHCGEFVDLIQSLIVGSGVSEAHVFTARRTTDLPDRYALLCRRLVLERLYDAACLIMSSRETGPDGEYREPDPQLSFRLFATSLVAHVSTFAKLRR